MSATLLGTACVLQLSDGGPSATFRAVEGARVTNWKISRTEVDVTSLADGAWRRLLAGGGIHSIELRVAGLRLDGASDVRLQSAALSGQWLHCRFALGAGIAVAGPFVISEFGVDAAVNEEVTFAACLKSAGPIAVG